MTELNHPPESNLPEEFLRQLAHGYLLGITQMRIASDSPPESTLAAALRFLLSNEVDQGRIEILQRERLVLPTQPAIDLEVDLLLRQESTGARGVVETVGWEWHRRSRDEFYLEIRRERLLRRHLPAEYFSAREVLENPWGIALEIVGLLGTTWPAFERVFIPPTITRIANSFAGLAGGVRMMHAGDPATPVSPPLSVLDRIRETVQSLPKVDPPSDPGLQAIRRDYPRAYETWHPAEVELLVQAFRTWIDIDDIAAALQRSPGAVWKQLRRMGLVSG
jgi:hypothetical protein